jgi:hypothetical protein
MVRAGMSLPALQHLMGHSQIYTTILLIQLAPQDIWRELTRSRDPRAFDLSANVMNQFRLSLEQIFKAHPNACSDFTALTVTNCRCAACRFLGYLDGGLSAGPPILATPS